MGDADTVDLLTGLNPVQREAVTVRHFGLALEPLLHQLFAHPKLLRQLRAADGFKDVFEDAAVACCFSHARDCSACWGARQRKSWADCACRATRIAA